MNEIHKSFRILGLMLLIASSAWGQFPSMKENRNLPSPYERFSHFQLTPRIGVSLPLGGLADQYIAKPGLPAYSLSMEWIQPRRFSFGVELGSMSLNERLGRATYTFDNQQISAVQTRTLRTTYGQAVASYHFGGPNAAFRPYIQAGLGAELVDYTLYWGSLATSDERVRLSFKPAVGLRYLFGKEGHFALDARLQYSHTPYQFDYIENAISAMQFTLGGVYRWW